MLRHKIEEIMGDFFNNLVSNPMTALGFVITMASACTIVALAHQWRMARVASLEADLKRRMLDKGMSVGEIEQVLRASQMSDPESDSEAVVFSGYLEADKATLVKLLTENDYSGADMARVLAAFTVPARSPNPMSVTACGKAVQVMIENGKKVEEIEQVLRAFEGREATVGAEAIQVSRG
jgi:cell division protein FtsL